MEWLFHALAAIPEGVYNHLSVTNENFTDQMGRGHVDDQLDVEGSQPTESPEAQTPQVEDTPLPETAAATPFEISEGGHETFADAGDQVTQFAAGDVILNQFEVLRVVGRGGMGAVYEVDDRLTHQRLALKAVLPAVLAKPGAAERFVQEVNIARRLRHPGIVAVYDVRQSGALLFYTMEFVDGQTLRDILDKEEKLSLKRSLEILYELCRVLEYAHKFTVHRDISPDNIMVLKDGRVQLLDFGIAMAAGAANAESVPMGKAYYMAPEQREAGAEVDARADIYSVAIVFFETLTGEYPSAYTQLSILRPDVPEVCEDVILKAMEPRETRYRTITQFGRALREACTGSKGDLVQSGPSKAVKPRPGTSGSKDNQAKKRPALRPQSTALGNVSRSSSQSDPGLAPHATPTPFPSQTPVPTGRSVAAPVARVPMATPVAGIPIATRVAPMPAPTPVRSAPTTPPARAQKKSNAPKIMLIMAALVIVILLVPLGFVALSSETEPVDAAGAIPPAPQVLAPAPQIPAPAPPSATAPALPRTAEPAPRAATRSLEGTSWETFFENENGVTLATGNRFTFRSGGKISHRLRSGDTRTSGRWEQDGNRVTFFTNHKEGGNYIRTEYIATIDNRTMNGETRVNNRHEASWTAKLMR